MIRFNELCARWNAMPVFPNSYLLIDALHPVDINIGYEALNQKTLLIRHVGEIPMLASSKSITAKNYRDENGVWVLSFMLIRRDNEEVFLRFCWDIIESTRGAKGNVITYILDRYKKWLRLLEQQRPDILGPSMQKGLMGELLHLEKLLKTEGTDASITAWCGPDGADQDFVLNQYWIEVKAVSLAADSVTISSLEQLAQIQPGILAVYFIEKTTDTDQFGLTLADQVSKIRGVLQISSTATELFESKLFLYGYKDDSAYNATRFRVHRLQEYLVQDSFPKLTKELVPNEIVQVKYAISLPAITNFLK